jgi:hypothetical protein
MDYILRAAALNLLLILMFINHVLGFVSRSPGPPQTPWFGFAYGDAALCTFAVAGCSAAEDLAAQAGQAVSQAAEVGLLGLLPLRD